MDDSVPVQAITGGPCAGKTTGKAHISQKLGDRGFYPLFVPEAATLLMEGNVSPISGNSKLRDFQYAVAKTTIELEEIFKRVARSTSHPRPVIFTDRGIPEIEGYCESEAMYLEIIKELGIESKVEARDGRYNAAFHLRSAAFGAEAQYSRETNKYRLEDTIEDARKADEHTLKSWIGHPHLRVIDNSTDFAGKLARLDQEICAALGVPVPTETERKFLCAPVEIDKIPVPVQRIEIEQVYIMSSDPNVTLRVRKRGQFGANIYYKTAKTYIGPGMNTEVEKFISKHEYEWSLGIQVPSTRAIQKHRYCFVYENQYFELDVIPTADGAVHLLEIELTHMSKNIVFPPFLPIAREVTDDRRYTNRALADLRWPNV